MWTLQFFDGTRSVLSATAEVSGCEFLTLGDGSQALFITSTQAGTQFWDAVAAAAGLPMWQVQARPCIATPSTTDCYAETTP
jgi:hypothetical protein